MAVHRREWFCFECNDKFRTDAEVARHLHKKHHIGNVLQISFLLEACQRPIRYFGQGSCQLCDEWVPAIRTEDNTKEYRRHLGHHLQSLALSAVEGQFIEGLELVEGGGEEKEEEKEEKEEAIEIEYEEDEEAIEMDEENEEDGEEGEGEEISVFSAQSLVTTISRDNVTMRQAHWPRPTVDHPLRALRRDVGKTKTLHSLLDAQPRDRA